MKQIFNFLVVIFLFGGCSKQEKPINISPIDYHNSVDRLTNIMIHDVFSPPVASRIYAYSNIAAYEIIAHNNEGLHSFSRTYKNFTSIPEPDPARQINYQLAALIAQMEIGKYLIFSESAIGTYQDSLYSVWKGQNEQIFTDSKSYGTQVAEHLKSWINRDNYNETRTMPKYSVYSEEPYKWRPTPPTYMDGIEPHWGKLRTFSLDSASQFQPVSHPQFSMQKNTKFYEEVMEVYNIKREMEITGDDSEKVEIAKFWDCNPYVSVQRGHLMFAIKKITPGGHWMGITKIAGKKSNLNFDNTIYAYAATSIAIADAFISCWEEKYKSDLVRPETLINTFVDEEWVPALQTPPFPEFPSGHSVVSGAAATVLTELFGENFSYNDDTEVQFGLPVRSFTSFHQAANEAAISRLYGGIHYRSAVEEGLTQGINLGAYIVNDLNLQPVGL